MTCRKRLLSPSCSAALSYIHGPSTPFIQSSALFSRYSAWNNCISRHFASCVTNQAPRAPQRPALRASPQKKSPAQSKPAPKRRHKKIIIPGEAAPSAKRPKLTTFHTKVNEKFTRQLEADLYSKNYVALKRLHEMSGDYEDDIGDLFKKCDFVNAYADAGMLPKNVAAIEMGDQRTISKAPWSEAQTDELNRLASKTPLREIAFIGRSNVGKSSLLSALVKNPKGLVRISKTPGRTQMLNYFRVGLPLVDSVLRNASAVQKASLESNLYLVDMPGYGFARAPRQVTDEWISLVKEYFVRRSPENTNTTSSPLLMTYLLIDAQLGELKHTDREFIQFFHEHQIPYTIVLTKIDRADKDELAHFIARILCTLTEQFGVSQQTLPLVVPTSAFANRNIGLLRMITYQYCFLDKGMPVEYFAKPVPVIQHHDMTKKKAQDAEAEGTKIFKIPRGERTMQSKAFSLKPFVSAPKIISKTEQRSEQDQKTYIRIMRHHGVFQRKKKQESKKRSKYIY